MGRLGSSREGHFVFESLPARTLLPNSPVSPDPPQLTVVNSYITGCAFGDELDIFSLKIDSLSLYIEDYQINGTNL